MVKLMCTILLNKPADVLGLNQRAIGKGHLFYLDSYSKVCLKLSPNNIYALYSFISSVSKYHLLS